MGQVSDILRRATNGYVHWCPACEEAHILPDNWAFDGNVERPTFHPSFKHEGCQIEKVDGKWTGEWIRGVDGKPLPFVCHYNLISGQLHFCNDCTHGMANKVVPLPKLPDHLKDKRQVFSQ